jgi:hypothetical protein
MFTLIRSVFGGGGVIKNKKQMFDLCEWLPVHFGFGRPSVLWGLCAGHSPAFPNYDYSLASSYVWSDSDNVDR